MGRRVTRGALPIAVCLALGSAVAHAARPVSSTGPRSDAIIGGDTQAIIGGDAQAIIGGDAQAIIGGDTQAIIGGDTQAIIGGDTSGLQSSAVVGLDPYAIFSADAILAGPVVTSDGAITVLGRVFRAKPEHVSTDLTVSTGQSAVVLARNDGSGVAKASRLVATGEAYVDGVSTVLVSGRVSRANPSIGSFQVDKITVEYADLMADGPFELSVDDKVVVIGVLPSPSGPIQATGIRFVRTRN